MSTLPKQELTSPPGAFVPVYITAKLAHAQFLVDLKKHWPQLYFTARWPVTSQHESEWAKLPKMWTLDNETDLLAAQVVVGFSKAEESTPLKDPLWELAIAHAHRKPIYLAGPLERFGNYAFCSSVAGRFDNLDTALARVSQLVDYETHADRLSKAIEALGDRFDRRLSALEAGK